MVKTKKWRASIYFRGKTIHLGRFEKIGDAIKARKEAEKKYFKPIIEEFKEVKEKYDKLTGNTIRDL